MGPPERLGYLIDEIERWTIHLRMIYQKLRRLDEIFSEGSTTATTNSHASQTASIQLSVTDLVKILDQLFPKEATRFASLQKVIFKQKCFAFGSFSQTANLASSTKAKIFPKDVLESLSSQFRLDSDSIRRWPDSKQMHGGKADVEQAILLLKALPDQRRWRRVALKKVRFDDDTSYEKRLAPFAHEVAVLSDLRHRNIVQLLGFVEDAEKGIAWIVLPWQSHGTLRDYVQSKDWKFCVRLELILDVVLGVLYLHNQNPPICHGDLKSANILVGAKGRAVISDFGSARVLDSEEVFDPHVDGATIFNATEGPTQPLVHLSGEGDKSISLSGPAYTLRWAAPELLDGACPSLKSDVWALGWICWEIFTGKVPFYNAPNHSQVVLKIAGGSLPALWSTGNFIPVQTVITFMTRCWTIDPSVRPSLDMLI